jgi:hypothetical protein
MGARETSHGVAIGFGFPVPPTAPWRLSHSLRQKKGSASVIFKKPKPAVTKDFCQACGGTGKAVRPHPKNVVRLSLPDCPRCNGAGRAKPI